MKRENKYKGELKKRLSDMFPGCILLDNNPNDIQGFPDLTILHKDRWATLECKRFEKASHRQNQDYYVDLTNQMSFGAFIDPTNEEEVLNDLQQAFDA